MNVTRLLSAPVVLVEGDHDAEASGLVVRAGHQHRHPGWLLDREHDSFLAVVSPPGQPRCLESVTYRPVPSQGSTSGQSQRRGASGVLDIGARSERFLIQTGSPVEAYCQTSVIATALLLLVSVGRP